jgi:fumarate hydratase subunit beta
MEHRFTVDDLIENIPRLRAGDSVLLTGSILTARDAAHKRLADMSGRGEQLPVSLENAVIYYCGPAPAKPGDAVGPCGPTTSSRMDKFTPLMLSLGVKATIGKGARSAEVLEAQKEHGAVYLIATGGVAALLSIKVRKAELVAFGDLGPEAIYRFDVVDFPLIVGADINGKTVFQVG